LPRPARSKTARTIPPPRQKSIPIPTRFCAPPTYTADLVIIYMTLVENNVAKYDPLVRRAA